jgi:hypothetical protein
VIAFVVTGVVASLLISQIKVESPVFASELGQLVQQIVIYSLAVLPYFFAGWVLGTIFRDCSEAIHRLYFVDLIGAALGCLLYLLLIRPLGAVNLVLLCCALPLVPVLIWRPWRGAGGLLQAAAVLGLAALVIFHQQIERGIQPHAAKAIHTEFAQPRQPGEQVVVELSEWNAISRIDVATTT